MRLAALRQSKMVGELPALRVAVSSSAESMLGCSSSDTFCIGVVGELAVEFQKMEERQLRLEWPVAGICDLLLGPPFGQARLTDHLDEATGQLRVELATQREVDAEVVTLWASAT
jgi:hypothetical protein